MISKIDIELISIFLESIGILLAEKRTAIILYFVTMSTIIIFFMTKH